MQLTDLAECTSTKHASEYYHDNIQNVVCGEKLRAARARIMTFGSKSSARCFPATFTQTDNY